MNVLNSGSTAEPDYSMALSKVGSMSRDELNEMLNDENKLDEYVKSLEQVNFSMLDF